ncbi:MAG: protein kinase domain-containing protein [Candidatus Sumerlaeaceae bacterium]
MPEMIAGKYEVLQTIGRGGMGTVYKAVQRNLDRVVAIKMLSEELASDPEFRARFQQEATVVARLSHPNIVAVYDIEPHNHTFCIIMEYLDGENLQAKIDRDVTLAERDIVLIGAQVARALGYAHSQGIIHRDVKPDNIHVTPKGVAKVMDFGIARFLDSKLKTQTGISMGTPKFMSPEQVTGKNVDGQTDLYSLGVCLYYCLAGRPPFDGENAIAVATRHLYEQPEPPSRYNTSISIAVEKVIMRALEKQKNERYATGFDMADALEGTLGIRSPIRISDDSGSGVYSGATQKITLQAVGGGMAEIDVTEPMELTPGGGINMPAPHSQNQSPRGRGWSNVTPVPMRSVAGGLDDFSGPEPASPTRPAGEALKTRSALRRWWPAFAAASLLTAGVAYLAFGKTAGPARTIVTGGTLTQPSVAHQFQVLQQQSDVLESQKRYGEARKRWAEFQSANRDYERATVEERIDQLTGMLPLSEKALLAERRRQKGLSLVASKEAVAAAYLQAAEDLDPQASKFAASQLHRILPLINARRNSPSEAERQGAQDALNTAKRLSSTGSQSNPREAEDAFLQAVSLEPGNGSNWIALADFYQQQHRKDDARVMYAAAAHYGTPDIKRDADRKRNALNQ